MLKACACCCRRESTSSNIVRDTKTAVNIDPELEGGVALMRDMQRFQFPPEHPQHLPVQFPSAPPRMEYCSAEQQAGWAEH